MKCTFKRLALLAATIVSTAALLSGCSGTDGSNGANGANGANGLDRSLAVVDSGKLTAADLTNVALGGTVTSASIVGTHPVVKFQVYNKANGQGIVGLRSFSLHIAQLKPEAKGSQSYWQNYIAAGLPLTAMPAATSAPSNPSTDAVTTYNTDGTVKAQGYTIVDNLDGSYTATFGADITANTKVPYDATLIHRIAIGVRSIAVPGVVGKTPGAYAGVLNPATNAIMAQFVNTNGTALIYDFVPATGMVKDAAGKQAFARDVVTIAACNQCHYKLEYGSNNTSGHMGSRPDTRVCVVCHTNQLATGTGVFTTFIHQIHMGEELPVLSTGLAETGANASEVAYPQDIRNCTMCHKGADVTNWNSKPTRQSCGSCHNGIDWTTGKGKALGATGLLIGGHVGGIATDDSQCVGCHGSAAITTYHIAVRKPDPTAPELGGINTHTYAGYLPAAGAVVPGAAVITWDVKAVAVVATRPTITFRFVQDGTGVAFNTFGAKTELMDNFVGSPSVQFAYAVPQDGIVSPADFNASAATLIKNVWNGTAIGTKAGTLTGPVNGYYTLTLTGVTIPATATMLTGGIGYTYGNDLTDPTKNSTPLTQTNVPGYTYNAGTNVGGLMTVVPNTWKVATGYKARRPIVSNDLCNACHAKLGVAPTFHSGQRNDAQTCVFCHNADKTNVDGWSVNTKDIVHAIHGAAKRTVKFSWESSAGNAYWKVGYPGVLKNCEACHLSGTYDFSASASASAVPNLLMSTSAVKVIPTFNSVILGTEPMPAEYISPFVTAGQDYGLAFNPATSILGISTEQDPTYLNNLVMSPISAVCFGCHDTSAAKAHMTQNGGSINVARSAALNITETCLVCHGAVSTTNITNTTTPAIKAVHRWW